MTQLITPETSRILIRVCWLMLVLGIEFTIGSSLVLAYGQLPKLDPTFNGGKVLTLIARDPTQPPVQTAKGALLQPDGKVVVIATLETAPASSSTPKVGIIRHNLYGSVDTSFGHNGYLIPDSFQTRSIPENIILLSGNKILVIGTTVISEGVEKHNVGLFLLQLLPDGTLDSTFGTNGLATVIVRQPGNTDVTYCQPYLAQQLPDQQLLITGVTYERNETLFQAKFRPNGQLNTTFGSGGFIQSSISFLGLQRVSQQRDQKILVGGTGFADRVEIHRFTAGDVKPDLGFGDQGIAQMSIPEHYSPGVIAINELPDQKIILLVAAIPFGQGASKELILVRFHPDGRLDTSFGNQGVALITVPSLTPESVSSLVPSSMQILADGSFLMSVIYDRLGFRDFLVVKATPMGELDQNWGRRGLFQTDFFTNADQARQLLIREDGRLLVVGDSRHVNEQSLALLGILTDGSPDPSFGDGGQQVIQRSSFKGVANGVALLPDGKLLMVGAGRHFSSSSHDTFLLIRLNPNGLPDTEFGDEGLILADIEGDGASGQALAVQSDGKILVAGNVYSSQTQTYDGLVARFNSDGTPDKSFGVNGVTRLDFSSQGEDIQAIALTKDGKIVLGGCRGVKSNNPMFGFMAELALIQLRSDGSLDPGFGKDGKFFMRVGQIFETITSLAIQPDGKIVAGGYVVAQRFFGSSDVSDCLLLRFLPTGVLDPGFGTNGLFRKDLSAGMSDSFKDIALLADGKIVGVGESNLGLLLVRVQPNGALDPKFGSAGVASANPTKNLVPTAKSVDVQPDGKLVVAGITNAVWDSSISLARYLPNGTLDKSFGVNGKMVINLMADRNSACSGVLQPDGKLVVVGESNGSPAIIRYDCTQPQVGCEPPVIEQVYYSNADDGLIVLAKNFDLEAIVLVNGKPVQPRWKTINRLDVLVVPVKEKLVKPGKQIQLQLQNHCGEQSEVFVFTRS